MAFINHFRQSLMRIVLCAFLVDNDYLCAINQDKD